MKNLIILLCLFPLFTAAQEINNLQLTEGYPTTTPGKLDNIKVYKSKGSRPLIIIAGWGLDDHHYADFASRCYGKFEVHVINVPGYRNTPVPPLPGKSYGDQTWTNAVVEGVHDYIVKNKIKKPIIAGHLLSTTQIATRLGLRYPDLVGGIVILSGPTALQMAGMSPMTTEKRIQSQDNYWAPKWFKTVSKKTWDDGNYPSWFYAIDSIKAKSIYNDVQANSIPVMVQYLEEYNAQDTEEEIVNLKVKMLVFLPDFAGTLQSSPIMSGVQLSSIDPWKRAASKNPKISTLEIKNSRSCVTIDQPEEVLRAIEAFSKH